MEFDDYKAWAITTRANTYQPIVSPVLSLVEEYYEFLYAETLHDSYLEAGDILWYVINLAYDLDIDLDMPQYPRDDNLTSNYVLAKLCGITKRSIRDQTKPNKSIVKELLQNILSIIYAWSVDSFEECMQMNYEKLTGRMVNGTIKDINRG